MTLSLVDTDSSELDSLYGWLQQDDEFRGRITTVAGSIRPNEMGGTTQALSVVLGSGGALGVLGRSLAAWLTTRRVNVRVEISAHKRRVEIDAANGKQAERLLRMALGDDERGDR